MFNMIQIILKEPGLYDEIQTLNQLGVIIARNNDYDKPGGLFTSFQILS